MPFARVEAQSRLLSVALSAALCCPRDRAQSRSLCCAVAPSGGAVVPSGFAVRCPREIERRAVRRCAVCRSLCCAVGGAVRL